MLTLVWWVSLHFNISLGVGLPFLLMHDKLAYLLLKVILSVPLEALLTTTKTKCTHVRIYCPSVWSFYHHLLCPIWRTHPTDLDPTSVYHHWLPFEVYYPTTDLNYPKTGLQLITSSLTKFRRNLYLSFLSRPTSKRSSNGPLSRSKTCFFLPSCTTMLTPTDTSTVSFPLIRSSKSFCN